MQINFFKVKKRKKQLYEGFKENKLKNEEAITEKKSPVVEKKKVIIKDNQSVDKVKNKSKKILKQSVPLTISIAALESKCGCTLIAQAMGNYIKQNISDSVCIVTMEKSMSQDEEINGVSCFKYVDICGLYDKYKFIIIDIGSLKERTDIEKSEFKRANIKVLVSKLEDNYLRQIAALIREDKDMVKNWTFLFNLIDGKQAKEVGMLMEDYDYYCLPLVNKEDIKKEVKEVFYSILVNRKKIR